MAKEGHGATKFIGGYAQYLFAITEESSRVKKKKALALDVRNAEVIMF